MTETTFPLPKQSFVKKLGGGLTSLRRRYSFSTGCQFAPIIVIRTITM
jgi:hypothetical protein